jgi:hypothetical protein
VCVRHQLGRNLLLVGNNGIQMALKVLGYSVFWDVTPDLITTTAPWFQEVLRGARPLGHPRHRGPSPTDPGAADRRCLGGPTDGSTATLSDCPGYQSSRVSVDYDEPSTLPPARRCRRSAC